MKVCEKCKKSMATVHLTEIQSGQRNERHLCEECARRLNLPHQQTISINDLIGTLLEKGAKEGSSKDEKVCPKCNMGFSEFTKGGRLGCAYDYTCFKEELERLLKKVHGSVRHIGKVPNGQSVEATYHNELLKLKGLLKKAVKAEDYEEAARIRDRVQELESLIGNPGQSEEGGS